MKAGFGKSDLTPRLGVQLAGYGPYRNRAAQEIVAPLAARAAVIRAGKTTVVLLSLELCGTPRPLAKATPSANSASASPDSAASEYLLRLY